MSCLLHFFPKECGKRPLAGQASAPPLDVGPAHNAKLHLTVALSSKHCTVPTQHHALLTLQVASGIIHSPKVRDNPSKAEQPQNRFIIRIKQ
jgi:hypothetical protein